MGLITYDCRILAKQMMVYWRLSPAVVARLSRDRFRSSPSFQSRFLSDSCALGRSQRSLSSYLIGSTEPALLEHTLSSHWTNDILPLHHHRLALISREEPPSRIYQSDRKADCLRLTYSQLDQSIQSIISALDQLGIRKGDRVGINTPNHSIYPILQWATAKMGAILATINPAYAPSELINAIKRVDCKVLFSTPSFKSKDMIPMLSSVIQQSESLTHLVIVDNESYRIDPRSRSKAEIFEAFDRIKSSNSSILDLDQLTQTSPDSSIHPSHHPQLNSQEIINLQFTSGTTGFPKAVSLTHRNLLNNAHHIAERMNLTSKDVVCNVPPMFHCFGSVVGNLASFVKGATLVIPSETFDPKAVIQTVSQESCTVLHGVGTMFLAEINELDRVDDVRLSSLRTGVIAGSPVSDELMNQIENRLGMKELTILYGMTETSPGTFQTRPDDDRLKRTTTVGTIYPHTRAKVIDLESGEIVPRDRRGELLVSGYSVQKGYWNDPIATAKAMIEDEEGRVWMRSGDIASIDSSGYLRIVGRAKDVIIRGGENVYPVLIENCIIKLDGVIDVAVVGVPDEFYGETVGAFVKRKSGSFTPKPDDDRSEDDAHNPSIDAKFDRSSRCSVPVTEKDVQQIVRSQLAGANVPKYVWFLDLLDGQPDFPMTASGKIKKTELIGWVDGLLSSPSKAATIERKNE